MQGFKLARRALLLGAVLLMGCSSKAQHWALTDISGHLPDLDFALTSDRGQPVTAKNYDGDVVMMYFGYTHCPDVCPTTLANMAAVMRALGPQANNVRMLFVSVDPARDTPALLHTYVRAFSRRAVGLTGSESAIADVARRYRVAYEDEKPDANGNYAVTHGSAIYIFDKGGHARLLALTTNSVAQITRDVRQLL